MKIYVSAKFEEKERVRALYMRLRSAGHDITHDWTREDVGDRAGADLDRYLARCAEQDVEGVATADCVVVLQHPRGKGMFVEVGAALALRKWVVAVGDFVATSPDCIFYWHERVLRVSSEDEALLLLSRLILGRAL